MGTVIRAELSPNNKYWISKHRYYELKHYCLQYKEWKDLYLHFGDLLARSTKESKGTPSNPTAFMAEQRDIYKSRMDLIRQCCLEADDVIGTYIFKAVTEGLSFINLKTMHDIPCERDMYYDRYRRFFWILSRKKSFLL